jgi:tetratricopeptide (TPR) repeat protein
MADGLQEQAFRLAVRARRDTHRGDYDKAIEQQEQAVELLERQLEQLEADPDAIPDERAEAVRRLSDHYGRLGGIYRRAGRVDDAVSTYRKGMELERRHRLDDSYNRTNWIALQVLDDPERLPALSDDIEDAVSLIGAQVEGPRRDQWWAWADYGLVSLLGNRVPEARRAYDRFRRTGARRVDYESVLGLLRSLRDRLAPSQPALAAEFAQTITSLESPNDRP